MSRPYHAKSFWEIQPLFKKSFYYQGFLPALAIAAVGSGAPGFLFRLALAVGEDGRSGL